jgi:hypothetical protein
MSHTHVYAVWQAMLQRCENPNAQVWENYGARGISVCAEWHKFERFFADMGDRPKGYSLERVDNDGNYCKENCEWVKVKRQANNTRRNRILEFNGEKRTLAGWAEWAGLTWYTLRARLDVYGWSLERALTTPPTQPRLYKFKGKSKTLLEWSRVTGIDLETLSSRVRKLGWSIERALTEPIAHKTYNRLKPTNNCIGK